MSSMALPYRILSGSAVLSALVDLLTFFFLCRICDLWVGERYVRIALNEIVRRVNPAAWPLPTEWKESP
jgi:hypothetical protein